jgi:hypothetical protein
MALRLFERGGVAEDEPASLGAVDRPSGSRFRGRMPESGRRKLRHRALRTSWPSSSASTMYAPRRRAFRGDEAFAAGEAAGESGDQHDATRVRRSAASMVLRMSMAMVSGPTPPGTGV